MATGKSLVIVESPAKAKTLEKFLGKDFRVLASYGHVRDLPKKGLGVDRSNSYEPTYEVLAGKAKMLAEIVKAARTAPAIYLAADPDRDSVTAVAYRWGFSSPSRFAAYYRRSYGVTPSHTLRN